MIGWYAERTPDKSARAAIVVALLALLLLAAAPAALLAAVILLVLGHFVVGLAVFGGSLLAAAIAVTLVGMAGKRQLRKLISRASFPVMQPDRGQDTEGAEPDGSTYTDVVHLDRSDYEDVR